MSRRPKPSGQHKRKLSVTITGHYCPQNGKVGYLTEVAAKMALARLRSQRPSLKATYYCPVPQCKMWHLSSQMPHDKEKKSERTDASQ